ncbi:hypothetical protein FF38_13274 [Lucilia cuprina]|uniref:Ubiquitin-like protease family profile domain-containing protein n=1 Tax=Lucilia cuprina TaxID=7375 RepID=A0A0L0CI90_LUCCU|nr:hypothetical protein FF38_13274 [Lucilia cuprina]
MHLSRHVKRQLGETNWVDYEIEHPYQKDTYNCGVYCCQFIEALVTQTALQNISDPNNYRKQMKMLLLKYRNNVEKECLHCEGGAGQSLLKCHTCLQSVDRMCFKQYYNSKIADEKLFQCYLCLHNKRF